MKTLKPVFKKNISSKNIIHFSFNKKNHSTLTGKYFFNKNKIKISAPNKKQFTFNLPLMGTHNAHNFLGAFALLRFFDLTQEQIERGLKTFLPPEGRSQIIKLNRNIVILDYYNANPDSMKAALELLSNTTKKESFACLGDMLELGSKELIYHQNLSTWIKKFKINNIFLYGELMKALQQKLKQIKYKGMYEHFSSQEALTNKLLSSIKSDSVILIKGSHGMKMENIWHKIKKSLKNK
ncbi:MAG: hypothetical protein HY072_03855 [Deltaproteobacteria bacterium]|nr:hypothetical protein [Deltaproteobacteria bacterium]